VPVLSLVGDIHNEIIEVLIIMAKGDRKTRKGKIWRGSYGKTRPHHPKKK